MSSAFHLLALGSIENSAQCLFYIFPNKSVFVIGAKNDKTVPNYFNLTLTDEIGQQVGHVV